MSDEKSSSSTAQRPLELAKPYQGLDLAADAQFGHDGLDLGPHGLDRHAALGRDEFGGLSLREIVGDLSFGRRQRLRRPQSRRSSRLRASGPAGHDQHPRRKAELVGLARQGKHIEHQRCCAGISFPHDHRPQNGRTRSGTRHDGGPDRVMQSLVLIRPTCLKTPRFELQPTSRGDQRVGGLGERAYATRAIADEDGNRQCVHRSRQHRGALPLQCQSRADRSANVRRQCRKDLALLTGDVLLAGRTNGAQRDECVVLSLQRGEAHERDIQGPCDLWLRRIRRDGIAPA